MNLAARLSRRHAIGGLLGSLLGMLAARLPGVKADQVDRTLRGKVVSWDNAAPPPDAIRLHREVTYSSAGDGKSAEEIARVVEKAIRERATRSPR